MIHQIDENYWANKCIITKTCLYLVIEISNQLQKSKYKTIVTKGLNLCEKCQGK